MREKKLMKLADYEDGSSFWRIACDCMQPDHDVNLWFESNDDHVELNLSMEVGFYWSGNWFKNLQRRVTYAFKILFFGHCTMEGNVILDSDGVTAMRTALDDGLKHIADVKLQKN